MIRDTIITKENSKENVMIYSITTKEPEKIFVGLASHVTGGKVHFGPGAMLRTFHQLLKSPRPKEEDVYIITGEVMQGKCIAYHPLEIRWSSTLSKQFQEIHASLPEKVSFSICRAITLKPFPSGEVM
jgi:hypothetical protein